MADTLRTSADSAPGVPAPSPSPDGVASGPGEEARTPGPDYSRPVEQVPVDSARRTRRTGVLLAGADLVAGWVAGIVTLIAAPNPPGAAESWLMILVAAAAWPLLAARAGVYDQRHRGHGTAEFHRLFVSAAVALAAASTAALAGADLPGAPGLLKQFALTGVPVAAAISLLVHVAGRIGLRLLWRRGRFQHRTIVVGMERSVSELVRAVRRDPGCGLVVTGACLTKVRRQGARGAEVEGVTVLGSPDDLVEAVRRAGADTVLVSAFSELSPEQLRRVTWELEGSGVQLLVAPRLTGVGTPRLQIRTIDSSPVVHVEEQAFDGLRGLVKATFDVVVAATLLLLLSLVLLVCAVAVKSSSPGPVLFRQERVGRGGVRFKMTKFRSMYTDAEERRAELEAQRAADGASGPLFKMVDDPRVTPVGKWLRRFSLDELPQLLDVLTLRMSLVGPRPPLPQEVELYEDDVRRRLRVRPGMTGLWQVSGRSNLSWDDAVRLDLRYVENWSLLGDLVIMTRTVMAVLARDGAY
ncbi:sugar transferase [Spongisporangium articulatum]|uniref:Sugar transferase n=1 Tax=Spongisporangium articulatum TaxID=3362603 RepID=A0ABW8ARF3_9ACTN